MASRLSRHHCRLLERPNQATAWPNTGNENDDNVMHVSAMTGGPQP